MKFSYLIPFIVLSSWLHPSFADELQCPADHSEDSLEDYRDDLVKKFVSGAYGEVKHSLNSCFSGTVPSCFQPLMSELDDHAEPYRDQRSREMERRHLDSYNDENPNAHLTLRSEKDLPKEFFVKDGVFRIPPNIKELARRNGWKLISYKTRSTGGFDNPPNLTLVAIPGRDKDIFIQISPPPQSGIEDPNDPKPLGDIAHGQGTATIITLDKTQREPSAQLRRMHRDFDGSGYRWTNRLESQQCISCHSTPLRSISPRGYGALNGSEKPMSPEDQRTVREINQMMVANGTRWGQKTFSGRVYNMGPEPSSHPLGWAPPNSPTREEEFVKRCASSARSVSYTSIGMSSMDDRYQFHASPSEQIGEVNWRKISAAMNCVQCHNDSIRGPIHSHFSWEEVQFKVAVDRSMPPGADLSMDERLALLNCLSMERYQTEDAWKKRAEWLKRGVCQAGPSNLAASSPGTDDANR